MRAARQSQQHPRQLLCANTGDNTRNARAHKHVHTRERRLRDLHPSAIPPLNLRTTPPGPINPARSSARLGARVCPPDSYTIHPRHPLPSHTSHISQRALPKPINGTHHPPPRSAQRRAADRYHQLLGRHARRLPLGVPDRRRRIVGHDTDRVRGIGATAGVGQEVLLAVGGQGGCVGGVRARGWDARDAQDGDKGQDFAG